MPFYLRFLPALVFVALVGFLMLAISHPKTEPASPMEGKPLPAFTLPSLTMLGATIDSQNAFHGSPYIINFFASWCAPCEAEHPLIHSLHKIDLPILGINWKDKDEDAMAWLKRLGDPYTMIGSDPQGSAAISLGVSGVPETFVIGADGTVLFHHAGPLDERWLNDYILPHFTGWLTPKNTIPVPLLNAPQATPHEPAPQP